MKARIWHTLIPLLGVLPVAAPPLLASEKPHRKITKRITHLIGMLASRNPAPKIIGDDGREIRGKPTGLIVRAVFDKSYDRDVQVSVYLAMQQLLAEGEVALDLLCKHEDDKRYCLTIRSMEDPENETVGTICRRIFWANILPFKDELHFITKAQYGFYPARHESESVKEWWKGKKKTGLARVQIEAIDAMLDFMQKADAKKATAWHPEAKKVPPAEFEKRRKKNIRILRAIRETILSTGKPYRPRSCLAWYQRVIGLQW
jgi:hypothetical protein